MLRRFIEDTINILFRITPIPVKILMVKGMVNLLMWVAKMQGGTLTTEQVIELRGLNKKKAGV